MWLLDGGGSGVDGGDRWQAVEREDWVADANQEEKSGVSQGADIFASGGGWGTHANAIIVITIGIASNKK